MSRHLVYFGNETLAKTAEKIDNIDDHIINLSQDMFNIMYRSNGIGLAAPQVDEGKSVIVIDIESYNGIKPVTLYNPEIISVSDEMGPYEEGCLSLPGINHDIIRPLAIRVRAVTPEGNEIEFDAEDLFARVLQHEIDHLNGIVFIDHLEPHERNEYRPELKKIRKMNKQ